MILEIENYSKTINKRIILDNINLTFRSGNVYGFYGRNGSGKTMLFRALTTLIYPTKGDVKVDGNQFLKKNLIWANWYTNWESRILSTFDGFWKFRNVI